ncbi:hypothetical protein BDW68DRAFT_165943 [Aspergillus falconensis]
MQRFRTAPETSPGLMATGLQRSTHYLSIPWRYGIPVLAISVTLHWLVSQSIFLVIVRYLSVEDKTVPWEDQTCGYSLVGMFLAVISMNVAMVLLIGLSMGPLTSYMPLAAYVAPPSLPRVTPPPRGRR